MKVLCEWAPSGPSYVRTGWKRVFEACGHQWRWHNPNTEPTFDAFRRAEPDIFIGTTYGITRAHEKCIRARPEIKVALFASAWGDLVDSLDRDEFPIVYATEAEKKTIEGLAERINFVFIHVTDKYLEPTMGGWRNAGVKPVGILNACDIYAFGDARFREELACDVGFTGGYWPFKARNLDRYLLPLCHPDSGLNVKIFGNSVWPTHRYLGGISEEGNRDLTVSAKVCPNVSEPHSTALNFDVIERVFRVPGAGGALVSDYVGEIDEIFGEGVVPMGKTPAEFHELIRHYVADEGARKNVARKTQKIVIDEHTYHDRVHEMFYEFGLPEEASRVMTVKAEAVRGL